MPRSLMIRNVDDDLLQALKSRAALNGRGVEDEHREFLKTVLQRPGKKSFKEILSAMPNVGEDSDFKLRLR